MDVALGALPPNPRDIFKPKKPDMRAWIILLSVCLGGLWGHAALSQVIAADYVQPTTRYGHGVLGDAVEWAGVRLRLADGRDVTFALPETLVFEDIAPRLADLDGDGAPEVIVVETSLTAGARLAIWGADGRITATPHIGARNRWLAPVGAADLDGDGRIEIAYVDRPHLAKVLRVWRYEAGKLAEVAAADGFTNHQIGWDFIPGGIFDCGQGAEMVLASGDWTRVLAARLTGRRIETRDLGPYAGPASLTCRP